MSAPRPVFVRRLPQFMRSVRIRLTLWSLVILAGVLAAFSAFVYVRQARDVDAATNDQLSALAEQAQVYFRRNPDKLLQAGTTQLGADFFDNVKVSARQDVIVEAIGLPGEVLKRLNYEQPA